MAVRENPRISQDLGKFPLIETWVPLCFTGPMPRWAAREPEGMVISTRFITNIRSYDQIEHHTQNKQKPNPVWFKDHTGRYLR